MILTIRFFSEYLCEAAKKPVQRHDALSAGYNTVFRYCGVLSAKWANPICLAL
jgi:hypothetical protein